MKILLMSKDERNAFLLKRLIDEGNEVKLLTRRGTGSWDGIIDKAGAPSEALAWGPDVVVVDTPGFGGVVKRFRERGLKVVGGGAYNDKTDEDYVTTMMFLEASGCSVCDYQDFRDINEAHKYIQGKDQLWRFIFPHRESRTFQGWQELSIFMDKLDLEGRLPVKFILARAHGQHSEKLNEQPYDPVPLRGDFTVAGFVNSRGVMDPCFILSRCCGLVGENQGIPTTEGVTLTRLPQDHPVVALTIGKVQENLYGLGYEGPVFFDCTVEGSYADGARPTVKALDFTLTPPDGFWAAFARGLEMPLHYFFDRLLNPRRPRTPFEFTAAYVSSRKITIPPYPLTEAPWLNEKQQYALHSAMPPMVPIHDNGHVYWNGIRGAGDGMKEIVHPVVGYVTGKAGNPHGSLEEIRREAMSIKIPYSQICTRMVDGRSLEDLPTWVAERQLEEEVEEVEELIHG